MTVLNIDRERRFPCANCGAKPGEPCVALKTGKRTERGRTIVPSHVSRKLASQGRCHHGLNRENCGLCHAESSDIVELPE